MEYPPKIVVGLIALFFCIASTAFAGGPEYKGAPSGINITGINVGLGGSDNTYRFTRYVFIPNSYLYSPYEMKNHVSSTGEVGYTYAKGHRVIGLRGVFSYANTLNSVFHNNTTESTVQFHYYWAVMLLAGLRVDEKNVGYIQFGYTGLQSRVSITSASNPGGASPVVSTPTLSGGIVGVGWRHYFVSNVFIDIRYNYAMYFDKDATVSLSNGAGIIGTASKLSKVSIAGFTATVNYLFNT